MWYKLPETKPKPTERPKPIFPWEQEPDRPKATRIFAEDAPTEPSPVMVSPTHVFSTVHYDDKNEASSGTLTTTSTGRAIDQADSSLPKSADETWQAFQSNNANAWDSVPGIENYVRSIVDSQGWRGKTPSQQTMEIGDVNAPLFQRRNRRESLILTDFPSAIERPSLPVTPAPLRRPSFWGDERVNQGELPSATGVPEQQEWVCARSAFPLSASLFVSQAEKLRFRLTVRKSPLDFLCSSILPICGLFMARLV